MDLLEPLYKRCLALREQIHQDDLAFGSELLNLRRRVREAYRLITDRGMRRAQRDPAYALLRHRIMEKVAVGEGTDGALVEELDQDDFDDLIEDNPEHRARLVDLAHEFGVALRPGHAESRKRGREQEQRDRGVGSTPARPPASPPPSIPDPPLWSRMREALRENGMDLETIERILRSVRQYAPRGEGVSIKNSDVSDQGSDLPDGDEDRPSDY